MSEQLSLFSDDQLQPPAEAAEAPPTLTLLSGRSTLAAALDEFEDAMHLKRFSPNTIQAFQADLRILAGYFGLERPIGQLSTKDLQDFLVYLLEERGRPCNPKSYARRITTLKVFFGWLVEVGARATDPAAALVHHPVHTPLPHVLTDEQVRRLLAAANGLAAGEDGDPRPALLARLVLSSGMKKGECMGIHLAHLDVTNPGAPAVQVRYQQTRNKHKERTIALGSEIVPVLQAYRARYKPTEYLFERTARNLEYVLRDLAQLAGIEGGVSFESLRWTAALRDYRAGMDEDALRRKLGLSKLRWHETLEKLEQMAQPAL